MSLERKIVVSADPSNAESGFDRLSASAKSSLENIASSSDSVEESVDRMSRTISKGMNDLETESSTVFKKLLEDSEKLSGNAEERSRILDQEINKLDRVNKSEKERSEHLARQRYLKSIEGVDESTDSGKKKKLNEFNKYKDEVSDIEAHALTERALINQVRRKKESFDKTQAAPAAMAPPQEEKPQPNMTGKNLVTTLRKLSAEGKTSFSSSEIKEAAATPDVARSIPTPESQKKAGKMELDPSRIESEASVAFADMTEEAEKLLSSEKERLNYLDKEITKLSQINKEEKSRLELLARQRYEKNLEKAGDNEGTKKKAKDIYDSELSNISKGHRAAQLHERIIRTKRAEYTPKKKTIVAVKSTTKKKDSDGDGRDDSKSRGRNIISRGVSSGGNFFRNIGNGIASGLGFGAVLSVGGFIGKTIDEGLELDKARARARAQGLRSGSVSGLKMADEINYSKGIAQSAGEGNVAKLATEQGRIERGTGMDLGSMNPFHTVMRSEREHGKTLTDATVEMLSIMKKTGLYGIDKSDFTMTHELLQRQNALNEIQAQNLEHISSRSSSQVMAAFGKVGGSFGDQRQTETIAQINSSITDPNNDFKRAFIMRSIFSRDPKSSLLDVMKAQEEGVFKEGQLQGIMEDLSKTFSGDQLVFSISKMFGLNLEKSQHLKNAFDKDPNTFKSIGSNEEVDKLVTTKTLAARGGVSQMEETKSKFDDKFAQWGSKALGVLEDWMKAYEKGGMAGLAAKSLEDITSAVKYAFKEGAKEIKEGLEVAFINVSEKLGLMPKSLEKPERQVETGRALTMIEKAAVSGLDSTDQATLKKVKADVALTKGDYMPNSRKDGEEIFEDVKDQFPHLFNDYENRIKRNSRQFGRERAKEFLNKSFPTSSLSGMGLLPEVIDNSPKFTPRDSTKLESLKKEYVQQSGENSSKAFYDQKEFLETGRTTNTLLRDIIKLTEEGNFRRKLNMVENANTTTVE